MTKRMRKETSLAYPNGSGATCDKAEAGVVLYPVIFVVLTYFLVYDVTTKSGSKKDVAFRSELS